MYSVSIIPKVPDQFFLINLLTGYIYSEILKLIHETHCLPPRRTLLIQASTATPTESCSRQWGEAYKPFIEQWLRKIFPYANLWTETKILPENPM